MIAVIVAIHIVVCITLITVVLLQQGKGADVGAVFGGSSQTVFGASGAGNLLTKITGICAAIFFATSIILAYSSTRHATGSIFETGHLPVQSMPAGHGAFSNKTAPAKTANQQAPAPRGGSKLP